MTRLLAAVALFGVVFVLPTEATSEDTPAILKEIAVPRGTQKF